MSSSSSSTAKRLEDDLMDTPDSMDATLPPNYASAGAGPDRERAEKVFLGTLYPDLTLPYDALYTTAGKTCRPGLLQQLKFDDDMDDETF
ncbi:UNVERIFIED_CONTAM: hypothetical protein HDU68_011418 [Siphonaria sp. JEL0065]|nr:hypothetical protein HDU68_011418 [Siphonaria sp. JEL0065]